MDLLSTVFEPGAVEQSSVLMAKGEESCGVLGGAGGVRVMRSVRAQSDLIFSCVSRHVELLSIRALGDERSTDE